MPDIIITPSTGKLEFIDNSAQTTRRHSFTLDHSDGLVLDAPLSAAAISAPLNVINVTVNNSNANYPFVLAQSGETGAKNLLMDGAGGTYNPFTNTATIDISGNSATTTLASNSTNLGGVAAASYVTLTGTQTLTNKTITGTFTGNLTGTGSWATNAVSAVSATTATNSTQLNGQAASYYTNIPARLGYTPVNQAGDTISGNFTVNGNFAVNGSVTAFSASNIYITSSNLTVTDNILLMNALSPYQRYAGIQMYDSGSGTLSQFLWDGEGDYFFLTGSSVNGKIITGPDGQTNLTSGYIPKATAGYKLGNSLIYDNGTNIGIGTTSPGAKLDVVGSVRSFSSAGNYGLITNGSFQAVGNHGGTFMLDLDNTGEADLVNIKKSGVSRFYIKNNGNIGIGTTNPSYKLEVYSGAKTSAFTGLSISNFNNYDGTAASLVTSQLRFAILENDTGTYNAPARTFAILESGNEVNNSSSDGFFAISTRRAAVVSEKFRITSAGNVGIGTSSPGALLELSSSTAASLLNVKGAGGNGILFVSGSGAVGIGTTSLTEGARLTISGETRIASSAAYFTHLNYLDGGNNIISSANGGSTVFRGSSNNITAMTILGTGNVGIGISNPSTKLDVVGAVTMPVIRQSTTLYAGTDITDDNSTRTVYFNIPEGGNSPTRYFKVARIKITGNYQNVSLNGYFTAVSSGNHVGSERKVEFDFIAYAATNPGAPTVTYLKRGPDTTNVLVYAVPNGGGAGTTYYDVYIRSAWYNDTNGELAIRAGYSSAVTVWQSGLDSGTSAPVDTLVNPNSNYSFDTSGNVGIGTTAPTTPLHVVGVISGSSFSGAGTGLTGTAASLTVGTATNATQLGGVAAASYVTLTGTQTLTNKTITGTFTGALTGNASTATALTSMNISQFTNNSLYQYHRSDITSLSSSATNVVQPLGTFDGSNITNAPTSGWYNYLSSTHGSYLTSLIANLHRTSDWYVGYKEGPGGTPTNPSWFKLLHSGNYSSYTNLTASWATNAVTALNVGNGTITIAAGTGVGVGTTNTFTTNQSGATTVTISNSGVTSNVAGSGISVSGATGAVTITNSGVTSAVAGTGVGVSAATGAVTFSIGQSVGTGNTPTFAGATLNGQLQVNHTVPTSIVRIYSGGSTAWSLGVNDAQGSYFNISADFGSILINKTNGNIWISGSGINNTVLHSGTTSAPNLSIGGNAATATNANAISFTEVELNAPVTVSGTWTSGNGSDWGEPKFGTSFNQYRYADGNGPYVEYNIPANHHSCFISQLQWNTGGYADCHGVQSDGDLVFLRRINTRQLIENSNHGNTVQHDGATVTFVGSGLQAFTKIRITNRLGRIHMTGIAFTRQVDDGYEGTGMVHPAQISHQGAGSGLDADLLDGYSSATANTANTIVLRDASGNFSAGTITATLSGTATTATTANALNTSNSYTGVNFTATGFFQTNLGQIKSDTSFALLTTSNGAQSVSVRGILLGTSYDTTPGANEIRTTNNTSLFLNARGTGDIQFQTADSLKMMLLNNGNVGVGVSNPSRKLDVEGIVRTRGASGTGGFEIGAASTGAARWRIEWDSASDSLDFNYVA